MAGDLLLLSGFPRTPSSMQLSPRRSISSTLSCPGAVGSPTYPKENSLPRMPCLILVTAPSAPIPRRTCLPLTDDAASAMLTRSLRLLTLNAPLRMSASMELRMEAIFPDPGVDP